MRRERTLRLMKKFWPAFLAILSVLTVASPLRGASAAGNSDKVVICHRTHSVTNPYVRITVAQRSVGNGNGKHGGNSHDQYSTVLFPGGKPVPNVYNAAITYTPAPEKKWGDIISSTDVSGNALTGTATVVAGLNNTGIGALIFAGTGVHANKCRSMTAREFYDIETTEGGQTAADVLADMNEADSDEWAASLTACGGTFTGCAASTLGASVPATTSTTTAPTTTVAATRKLKGTLWIDANRDGKLGTTEKVLANYAVTVRAGAGNSSTQTYTVTTDASGNYEVSNLPAGNWIVTPAALPNANYEKVYDTDSGLVSADWSVVASVPSTGTATADFATAMTSAAVAAGAPDILGSTAAAPVTGTGSSAGAGSSTDSGSAAVTKGSLKGNLWVDANRNGVRDAGEKILSGYALTIRPGAGNPSTRTYSVATGSAGNFRVSSLRTGKWVITASPLSNKNYEGVFDTDSGATSVNWVVTLTVKNGKTAHADFAAALTKAAVASGIADDLGATAVLPETGFGSTLLMVWAGALLLAGGAAMTRRSRRRLI